MPDLNVVVSTVVRLDPPLDRAPADLLRAEGGVSIELEGGQRARLDPADPRSAGRLQVLEGMREQRIPVYLELGPDGVIDRIFIPYITRVSDIQPLEQGALSVMLDQSQARHVLRLDREDSARLESLLREALDSGALQIVTEDDAHNIIDVRLLPPPGPGAPPLPPRFPKPFPIPEPPRRKWPFPLNWLQVLLEIILGIIYWWLHCTSAATAQNVFNTLSATTCNPLTVPPPCIPFLYPDDGCWGRAHEMCRLMINMGLQPRKVWIQGSLCVDTRNNPNCEVFWGWHVAPTLCVRGPYLFQTEMMVIDPALFTTPVTKATWKGVQHDPAATLTDSDASIFYLWGSVTDPTYTQTNIVLANYRLQLQNRSINQGPPPYASCP